MIPSHQRHVELSPWKLREVKTAAIELGNLEYEFVRVSLNENGGYCMFLPICVEGPKIRMQELQRAALALQMRHPVLRSRLVRTGKTFALETNHQITIPVFEHARLNDNTSTEYYENSIDQTSYRDLPLEIHVFVSAGVTDVAFYVNHFICDGPSLFLLMDEFLDQVFEGFKYYPAPPSGFFPRTMDDHLLKTFENLQVSNVSFVRGFIKNVFANFSNVFTPTWYAFPPGLGSQSSAADRTLHFHRKLSASESELLLQQCKARKLTITSIVAAALNRGVAKVVMKRNPKANNFGMCVSCVTSSRNDLTPPANPSELSAYVGSCIVGCQPRDWKTFSSEEDLFTAAHEFRSKLQHANRDEAKLYNDYWTKIGLTFVPSPWGALSYYLSSWGQTQPIKPAYANGKYKIRNGMIFQTTTCNYNPLVMVYSICQQIHITISGSQNKLTKEDLEEALDYAVQTLKGLCRPVSKI